MRWQIRARWRRKALCLRDQQASLGSQKEVRGRKKGKSIGKHCLRELSTPHSSTEGPVLVKLRTVHRAVERALARKFQDEFPDRYISGAL